MLIETTFWKKVATCCPTHRSLKFPPNIATLQFVHFPILPLELCILQPWHHSGLPHSQSQDPTMCSLLLRPPCPHPVHKFDQSFEVWPKSGHFWPQNIIFHFYGKIIAGVTMFNHIFKRYLGRRSLFVVFEPGWQKLRENFYAHCESKNFALAERLSTSATLFWAVFRTTSVVVLSTL